MSTLQSLELGPKRNRSGLALAASGSRGWLSAGSGVRNHEEVGSFVHDPGRPDTGGRFRILHSSGVAGGLDAVLRVQPLRNWR
jgi:hypothetical protein